MDEQEERELAAKVLRFLQSKIQGSIDDLPDLEDNNSGQDNAPSQKWYATVPMNGLEADTLDELCDKIKAEFNSELSAYTHWAETSTMEIEIWRGPVPEGP